jgi:hypothetical protein
MFDSALMSAKLSLGNDSGFVSDLHTFLSTWNCVPNSPGTFVFTSALSCQRIAKNVFQFSLTYVASILFSVTAQLTGGWPKKQRDLYF